MIAADSQVRTGRRRMAAGLLGLFGLLCGRHSRAHGDITPKRGGLVAWAGEISVEVVLTERGVSVYLDDHGEPLDAQGIAAQLVGTPRGGESFSLQLRYVKGNQLEGPAPKLDPGDRFAVVLRQVDGSVSMARFHAS